MARVAASVAGAFGFDKARIRRLLEDAFQNGGEVAVKKLLKAMIEAVVGAESPKPSSPYGPPVEPSPFPKPRLKLSAPLPDLPLVLPPIPF